MEPSAQIEIALGDRLAASSAVTSLVPANNILDVNARPVPFPSIIIGEGQTVPDEGLARNRHEVFADLHIWVEEAGTGISKKIAGAIRATLADSRWSIPGLHVIDLQIASTRFMRDPDGKHSHGVMTISARVLETA